MVQVSVMVGGKWLCDVSRITKEGSLGDGLSALGWPVDISMGFILTVVGRPSCCRWHCSLGRRFYMVEGHNPWPWGVAQWTSRLAALREDYCSMSMNTRYLTIL